MNDTSIKKTRAEGRALLRVSKELRDFLADVPPDDAEGQSLLRDCDTLDRVGHWLSTCQTIACPDGIDTAGSAPHIWTPDETKNRCRICGDGVWGRHRFQSDDPGVSVMVTKAGA